MITVLSCSEKGSIRQGHPPSPPGSVRVTSWVSHRPILGQSSDNDLLGQSTGRDLLGQSSDNDLLGQSSGCDLLGESIDNDFMGHLSGRSLLGQS